MAACHPKPLEMLQIRDAIVTIDAMGCCRASSPKGSSKRGRLRAGAKGNQGSLRDGIGTRKTIVFHDLAWLQEHLDGPGLNGVIIVESTREIGGTIRHETSFSISSIMG